MVSELVPSHVGDGPVCDQLCTRCVITVLGFLVVLS